MTGLLRRAGTVVVAVAAGAAVLLPSTIDWIDQLGSGWAVRPALLLGDAAALLGCIIAIAVTVRRRVAAPAAALAHFLIVAALAYGLFTIDGSIVDPSQVTALQAGSYAACILAASAFARFSMRFPRVLTLDNLPAPDALLQSTDVVGRFEQTIERPIHRFRHWLRRTLPPNWAARVADPTVVTAAQHMRFRRSLTWATQYGTRASIALAVTAALITLLGVRELGLLLALNSALVFGVMALTVIRLGYATSDAADRRRTLWVFEGLLFGGFILPLIGEAIFLIAGVLEMPQYIGIFPIACGLGGLVFVVSLLIGTFFHGAIDPGLAVRKTTLYGTFAALAIGTFAFLEFLITNQLQKLGIPAALANVVVALIAGGLIAIVRGRIHDWADRVTDKLLLVEPGRQFKRSKSPNPAMETPPIHL